MTSLGIWVLERSSIAALRPAASACALYRSRKQWQYEDACNPEDVDAAGALKAHPSLGQAHTDQHAREHDATTANGRLR
jgi:hypothetical protein